MPSDTNPFGYVYASAARRETLARLAAGPASRRDVVDSVEGSESAVYDAFVGLSERGLIVSREDGWTVTGLGRAVADCLDRCRRVDAVVCAESRFWRTHAVAPLPRRVRDALFTARNYEILPTSGSDPDRADRRLAALLETASGADVLLHAARRPLVAALERVPDPRVVVDRSVLESDALDAAAERAPRTTPLEYTMILTDDTVALLLPPVEDESDRREALLVHDEAVRACCRRLFAAAWRRADAVDGADRSTSVVRGER